MSVQVIQSILYAYTKALLEATGGLFVDPDRGVRPGNRLWTDGDRSDPQKSIDSKKDHDYPESLLDYGDFTYSSGDSRYGQRTAPTGRTKTLIQNFRLTLTYSDMRAKINDPLNMAIIDLLEAGGPSMGVAENVIKHVERGDIRCTGPVYGTDNNNKVRSRFVFTWPVTARWKGEPSPTRTI